MAYDYAGDDYNEDMEFSVISVGEHKVTCEEATEKQSSAGNDMMELVFRVEDGEGAGGLLWHYIVYNQYAAQNFGRLMESMGMDPTVDRRITPELFLGKSAVVMVKHENSESYGTQAKIRYFKRGSVTKSAAEKCSEEVAEKDDIPF
jgi:hypothetical protein